ncbi:VanZ family protein [Alicyclobacillus mengziensis]|uniref:VanZ family protein n=1 Tax=Alicyclobacillus mengziensis TaxID=2931921 RepID=A0A9X7VUK1_9BACL|nr:VanZ family protein [Alicyclobacillus mengziensis]QSO45433.1 VanZ family protein [Alicyclobacillus mengziensis]
MSNQREIVQIDGVTETNAITKRSQKKVHVGYLVGTILWCCLLLVGVMTSSVAALIHLSSISFHLDPHPVWRSFFFVDFYSHLDNQGWIITKLGHFIGFGILDVLISLSFRRHFFSSVLAFLFAVGTELLQIPFGRDGRLYDVYIDTLGIAVIGFLYESWPRHSSQH